MAAILERNGKDGRPMPSNIPAREIIHCPAAECEVSYTLAYTDAEIYVRGRESNVDVMKRMAAEQVRLAHPAHITLLHIWDEIGEGPDREWSEVVSLTERARL
jgi:hypothetical protein